MKEEKEALGEQLGLSIGKKRRPEEDFIAVFSCLAGEGVENMKLHVAGQELTHNAIRGLLVGY